MYVQEITELRRQGELSKAFELAYNAWDRDKADPFLQMSLFWVLRDMCYRFFKHGYFDEVDVCLKEMKASSQCTGMFSSGSVYIHLKRHWGSLYHQCV